MKKLLFIFVFIFSFINSFAQESPYPIIFVHGLNSEQTTWETTFDILNNYYDYCEDNNSYQPNHVFNAVLNAYTYTNIKGLNNQFDSQVGSDDDVQVVFSNDNNDLLPGSLYLVNFHNAWTTSHAILYNEYGADVSSQSYSNQSSVYKAGLCPKKMC